MPIFILFLALFIIFIVLIVTIAIKIVVVFDTDDEILNAEFYWLYPIIKGTLVVENFKPVLTLYFLKKKVYRKTIDMGTKKKTGMQLLKSIDFKDVHVNADYGFQSVFSTGIICGIINFISSIVNIDSLQQNPDFLATRDYIFLKATADVNIISNIKVLFKASRLILVKGE